MLEKSPPRNSQKRSKSAGKKSPAKVRNSITPALTKEQIKLDKKIAKKLLKAEQNIDKPKKLKAQPVTITRPASTNEKKSSKLTMKNPNMKFI